MNAYNNNFNLKQENNLTKKRFSIDRGQLSDSVDEETVPDEDFNKENSKKRNKIM